jgi:uncharacterized protein (TIGR02271 family)
MAKKAPVHVELRETGWAVAREGSGQATSIHPTQNEAAKEGRDIARQDETEFYLHAQDGRVREHRSYGEGSPLEDEAVADQTSQMADAAGGETDRDRSEGIADIRSDDGTPGEETYDAEEAQGLTEAGHGYGFGTPEERYAGFEVYDRDGERIGRPDDLFVDEDDVPEYVGIRMGSSGASSALVPAAVVTVVDTLKRMVVSRPRSIVESGPRLGHAEQLTTELEEQVRGYYGLPSLRDVEARSGYGSYYRSEAVKERGGSGTASPSAPDTSGSGALGERERSRGDLVEPRIRESEEELKVRRSEEELRVDTREREAGAVRVRKRVRTDRERLVVPKKRVEVTVERVPVEGEAPSTERGGLGPEISEDEIVIPVVEEEVVVEKRPVVKEEIHIRKDVVEDTEVVEEEVRREEVEVEEQTEDRAIGTDHPKGD